MTTDNHPLTPKPVDDRGAGVQVTQADRELLDAICGPYFTFKPAATRERLQMIARHREQAERGLRELARANNDLARMQAAQLRDMRASNAAIIEALAPFVDALDDWGDDTAYLDRSNIWEHPVALGITIGDLRAARKALDTRP